METIFSVQMHYITKKKPSSIVGRSIFGIVCKMKKTWDTKNGPKTFPASKDLQLWNPMHPKIGLLSWDFNLLEKRQKKS